MPLLNPKRGIHTIEREDIYNSVLMLYRNDEIVNEYPFRIAFEGERAVDFGGVTRDMFSGFFEAMYHNLFDGAVLVTPTGHPGTDFSILPLLGTIISHAYLVAGVLPTRIAFPCLASVLYENRDSDLPENIMISTFIDSLSCHDGQIITEALQEAKQDLLSFSGKVSAGLQHLLGFYQCREIPRPNTLKRIIIQIAEFEFKRKPAAAIAAIQSGIPKSHQAFWKNMSIYKFYSIYSALSVSTYKILQMLDNVSTSNQNEETVLSYLRQYIGNMRTDELRVFLRFVTGSCVCTASGIKVSFNRLDGLARRPIAHTCSYTLEISTSYFNYAEFSSEFDAILSDKGQGWRMDAL